MATKQESGLCAMRFTRLQSNGLPIDTTGGTPTGAWSACDPIKVELSFEYDQGTDTVQKDGCGRLCFARKRPNNLKSGAIKFELCGGSPSQLELILGGTGSKIGGATPTGFGLQNAACNTPARTGIFIEWWTENYLCNTVDPTIQWTRHFTPRVIADYDGGTWDEGRHAFAFTGVANAGVINPSTQATGGGPFNDIDDFSEDEGFLYGFQSVATESTVVENLTCGDYEEVPEQGA